MAVMGKCCLFDSVSYNLGVSLLQNSVFSFCLTSFLPYFCPKEHLLWHFNCNIVYRKLLVDKRIFEKFPSKGYVPSAAWNQG